MLGVTEARPRRRPLDLQEQGEPLAPQVLRRNRVLRIRIGQTCGFPFLSFAKLWPAQKQQRNETLTTDHQGKGSAFYGNLK